MAAVDPIERLVAGYKDFRRGPFEKERERFRELAEEGQAPDVMVIACADSRVSPALLFSAGPGELFTLRNVANLVPPFARGRALQGTGAGLEFAVAGLGVSHIVVLGHSSCGGIEAYRREKAGAAPAGEAVSGWISLVGAADSPVEGESDEEAQRRLERASIVASLGHLTSYPVVGEAVAAGRVALHGWYYDLAAGELFALEPASGRFTTLA